MEYIDYEKIKKIVSDIYLENANVINKFPIDVYKLAENMRFKVIKFSSVFYSKDYNFKQICEFYNLIHNKDIGGTTILNKNNWSYTIYINDIDSTKKRQRFSLAHEIGHIVLYHIYESKENHLLEEKEADYFASYLLSPDCVVLNDKYYDKFKDNLELISNTFDISIEAAKLKNESFKNRKSVYKNMIFEYERTILDCFGINLL